VAAAAGGGDGRRRRRRRRLRAVLEERYLELHGDFSKDK